MNGVPASEVHFVDDGDVEPRSCVGIQSEGTGCKLRITVTSVSAVVVRQFPEPSMFGSLLGRF